MTEPMGLVARDRTVIAMEGADARAVLQGVVTSDVERIGPDRLVYAALLTPQGKYLFDFFLFPGNAGAVLIDVAAERAPALEQRLRMYCLRRDARVVTETRLAVALVWGARPEPAEARVFVDPRDPALGWRLYAAEPETALGAIPRADIDAYTALRVAHGVPETGIELEPEGSFILETGFERLGGVDFRKGCYVGQEVTARMKHKADLKKRLVRVRVEGQAPPGTPVTADGKPAGTLYSQADGHGLAHLRLDRAQGAMEAGAARLTLAD